MMPRLQTESMSRLVHRAASLLVVCVFLSLPTLARLHDHLSAADNVAGFRLSKNLERPHERQTTVSLPRIATPSAGHDTARAGDVAPLVSPAPPRLLAAPTADRAPPAR